MLGNNGTMSDSKGRPSSAGSGQPPPERNRRKYSDNRPPPRSSRSATAEKGSGNKSDDARQSSSSRGFGKDSRKDKPSNAISRNEEKKRDKNGTLESSDSVAKLKHLPADKVKTALDLEAQWVKEEEEKKKEEENKRQEEEGRQKEEEQKRKADEEIQKQIEEKKLVQDFIAETQEKLENKVRSREANAAAAENRPDESFFSKLDSSLKKNTAFVKKLRVLSESQKDSLTKDFQSLNLTKYVGEVAAAITEAKMKMSDIPCAQHICSIMHQRYADFSQALLENWQKYLLTKKDEKISNPSKYRVDLRFFGELTTMGVFTLKEGLPLLANQLSLLINSDKEEHNNLSILITFCKHCGDDYIGLLPRKYRILAEKYGLTIPRSDFLPNERQKGCRNLLGDYYASLCKHLTKDFKELKGMERQNRKILQTKGELSADRKEKYEEAYNAYQKLYSNTSVLSDLLDEDMPELPEEDLKQDEGGMLDIFNPLLNVEFQYEGDSALFEDEDARSFYETLPDLKAFIPGILYKESEQSGCKQETQDEEKELAEDMENLEIEDVEREIEITVKEEENQSIDGDGESAMTSTEKTESVKDDDKEEARALEEMGLLPMITDEDDTETGNLMKLQFEAFTNSLPNSVNRELIDKAAIEFCMNFNTKTNRKKLVRALFTVHRTRYDLLPFYSRMVATLHPIMTDVSGDLAQLLKGDFRWHVRKKDQINIESKLKTVRFIGELTKFRLFPKSEALHCLKMLMFDFSHHNIEMACALLETCGRFLYRSMDSHHRTKVYLDVMMRKKAALHLDSRYTTMIENAYYYSNPPDASQVQRKERPPVHEYIRKLLFRDLSKVTTEKVLRQMRKLNWDDPEVSFYATKCLTAIWNVRFNSIHCAANLLAGLAPYHEIVAIQVVDGVLEDIRLGMEINHPKYNQRRVSCVKFLGELYNYRMVESAVIFKTLYSFITFGVSLDEMQISPLDSPEHLFRIRLVCMLLETCGQYFDKGSSKKKLDCFLAYFQRYYWFKHKSPVFTELCPFPVDIENLLQDTLEMIRPKLKLCQSFEEAQKMVEDLENEFKPKLAAVLPIIDTEEADTSAGEVEDGLSAIPEADELSDLSQSLSQTRIGEEEDETSQEDYYGTSQRSQMNEDEEGVHSEGENEAGEEGWERVEEEEDMDEDDEYTGSAGEEDLEDQVNVLTGGPKHVKCQEDEDFMTSFDKMIEDTIKARNQESLKVPQLDIAVPVHLKKNKIFDPNEPEEKENDTVLFTLMTKKGSKQQFANLNVPVSAEFASKFKEREQAEKAEKQRMKQVVLGIHERQEEEDYQEMLASLNRPVVVNTNRERRVRYQHPKGAPDADLIFGSKKR
ncbi:hypothetical protein CHS0354_021705 [Potamilus streckersoni]|uniref:Regulator of nonsense transcripts 2 n=1 Tax=Potamilus streckersoni TaxID=2493646 RepID=A0AAE0WFI2_9BIVA|nr:hypothetical protein CHS0354_021705 [Potamilus streckersoni]